MSMRKIFAVVLLAVSLLVNVVLLAALLRPQPADVLEVLSMASRREALDADGDDPPPAPSPARQADLDGSRESLDLAQRLRLQGVSEAVVKKLIRADQAVRWHERRRAVEAAKNAAIESGDMMEWIRLEDDEGSWRKQMELRLLREWGEVEGLVPWLTPEQRMLPPDWSPRMRWEVRWIEEESARAFQRVEETVRLTSRLPEDAEALGHMHEERTKKLEMLLSPVELYTYELMHGQGAEEIVTHMRHSQMREGELLSIFQILAEELQANGGFWNMDEDKLRSRWNERLGEEQTARFEMVVEKEYLRAADVVERFGLPLESAETVFRLEQAKARSREEIDPVLSAEEKQQTLQDLEAASDELLLEVLGPEAMEAYRAHQP